jgi:hypothetical protein
MKLSTFTLSIGAFSVLETALLGLPQSFIEHDDPQLIKHCALLSAIALVVAGGMREERWAQNPVVLGGLVGIGLTSTIALLLNRTGFPSGVALSLATAVVSAIVTPLFYLCKANEALQENGVNRARIR